VKINVIAIDDEPLALGLIESHIRKIPYLKLIGSYFNPLDALEIVKGGDVDLIFLDIHMPDIIGIDFIKGLPNPPKVVFITAYDNYAVQGFEVRAVDYLLKPVSFTRFLAATEKVRELSIKKQKRDDFIFVKSEHNVIRIELETIQFIEGYKDYLKIHTDHPKPILTITTFKVIEDLLPDNFLRIHKSYIVAVNKIISFRNGKVSVKDRHLPIGDSYRDAFNRSVVEGRAT
jgi:two-component system, LytTR family, response regulator